jgi:hypothetical protein
MVWRLTIQKHNVATRVHSPCDRDALLLATTQVDSWCTTPNQQPTMRQKPRDVLLRTHTHPKVAHMMQHGARWEEIGGVLEGVMKVEDATMRKEGLHKSTGAATHPSLQSQSGLQLRTARSPGPGTPSQSSDKDGHTQE